MLPLLSDGLLTEPSSLEHDKAREEQSITTDLPGFCPAVWQPDLCRPLVALGPDPLSWSSGTLATKRFYRPFFRMTNRGKPYLVIRFTNALPFYFTISTLAFPKPVKPSSALKATDVAIGIRPALHRRDKDPLWCFSTTLDEHGIGGLGVHAAPALDHLGEGRCSKRAPELRHLHCRVYEKDLRASPQSTPVDRSILGLYGGDTTVPPSVAPRRDTMPLALKAETRQ